MTTTIHWAGTVTAVSSIAHGGDSRAAITLLRREMVISATGEAIWVPVISGNAVRGRLRRHGEELLRDVLHYEGQIPLAAAHILRGGGSLTKVSGEPLTGRRLRDLRALIPNIGIFGAAAGGRIIDGNLHVGRLIPHLTETEHLTGHPGPTMLTATQLESYTRTREADTAGFHAATAPVPLAPGGRPDLDQLPTAALEDSTDPTDPISTPMLFRIETFPAGTRFASWIRLERASDLQVAFFADVLTDFLTHGRIGGRAGIGHGVITADLTRTDHPHPATPVDWRTHLSEHRDEALAALKALT